MDRWRRPHGYHGRLQRNLHLSGSATWHGNAGVEHFGDTQGDA
jgi:hypothetical protein